MLEKFEEHKTSEAGITCLEFIEQLILNGAIVPTSLYKKRQVNFVEKEGDVIFEMSDAELAAYQLEKRNAYKAMEEDRKAHPNRPPIQSHFSLKSLLIRYLYSLINDGETKRSRVEIANLLALLKHHGLPVDQFLQETIAEHSKVLSPREYGRFYNWNFARMTDPEFSLEEKVQRAKDICQKVVEEINCLSALVPTFQTFKAKSSAIDPERYLTGLESAWEKAEEERLPVYQGDSFKRVLGSARGY